MQVDIILFCDTGLEFPQLYKHVKKVEQNIGRPITMVKCKDDFEYLFAEKPIKRKKQTQNAERYGLERNGYSWAGPKMRWCTQMLNWSNDNVWQFLLQYPNPWGHSNKDLMSMYSGASADGECPLVIDTSTPSCGNSRFGCWVCTMVTEDKSMAAMIQNDEEKSWMLPMLDFRNEIAGDWDTDRKRRDFRRKDGRLTWHNNRLVHGPYTKETREYFLRRLLEVEKLVHEIGPDEIKSVPLITNASSYAGRG